MYDIGYRRSALKEIKKLDKPNRKEMISQIESCARKPYVGKRLKGSLSGYLSHVFYYKGINYRVIYTVEL